MIDVMHIKSFVPMDKIEPNTAAVTTLKHGKRIITLLGEDPRRQRYIMAAGKDGKIYHIRKEDLYCLLTGRKP